MNTSTLSDKLKLSDMTATEFMRSVDLYLRENFAYDVCKSCGGTGFVPVFCCGSSDCGCFGNPYDFKTKCDLCGKIAPEDI